MVSSAFVKVYTGEAGDEPQNKKPFAVRAAKAVNEHDYWCSRGLSRRSSAAEVEMMSIR